MESASLITLNSEPLSRLSEFVEVLEHGYHPIGHFSFLTAIIEQHEVVHYAAECIDEIDVPIAAAGWGTEGLVVDFYNQHDLSLFSLAYRGPRAR